MGQPVVLIADDDPDFRLLVKFLLAETKVEVREAVDGNHALEQLRAEPTSILILDLVMPKPDGIEIMHQVKREFPDVKVVAVSGAIAGQTYLDCLLLLGADAAIRKRDVPACFVPVVTALLPHAATPA